MIVGKAEADAGVVKVKLIKYADGDDGTSGGGGGGDEKDEGTPVPLAELGSYVRALLGHAASAAPASAPAGATRPAAAAAAAVAAAFKPAAPLPKPWVAAGVSITATTKFSVLGR